MIPLVTQRLTSHRYWVWFWVQRAKKHSFTPGITGCNAYNSETVRLQHQLFGMKKAAFLGTKLMPLPSDLLPKLMPQTFWDSFAAFFLQSCHNWCFLFVSSFISALRLGNICNLYSSYRNATTKTLQIYQLFPGHSNRCLNTPKHHVAPPVGICCPFFENPLIFYTFQRYQQEKMKVFSSRVGDAGAEETVGCHLR